LSEILDTELRDASFARQCLDLADEVEDAVRSFAQGDHIHYGTVYAYEVDGFGNQLFMDDANIPSLLSLPYLGCCAATDPVYQNTRRFVLSEDNPYFFRGTAAEGIGGPHVGLHMVWPLGIIMRALTSTDDAEILHCLRMLRTTHAGTRFMHESFHKDNPAEFTRAWFAWANALFGELIVKLKTERPSLLTASRYEGDATGSR
jgi:meiotically up-regulated gene 157 (Mug157) protein